MKRTVLMLTSLLLAPLTALRAAAPSAKPNSRSKRAATESNVSKVPKFNFARTLQEQEAQLKSNPLVRRFAESRRTLAGDPHRPILRAFSHLRLFAVLVTRHSWRSSLSPSPCAPHIARHTQSANIHLLL